MTAQARQPHAEVRCGGFTLLELVVVLALVALAAGVALPRLKAPPDRLRLQAAASEIGQSLRSVRAAAIATGFDQTLTLDGRTHAFWTSLDPRPHAIGAGITFTVDGPAVEQPTTDARAIRFRPDGSASDVRLTMKLGALAADVTVEWITGLARTAWRP